MSKLLGICTGFGLIAAAAVAPAAHALSPLPIVATTAAAASAPPEAVASDTGEIETTRVKRVGTRLETIVVTSGAVDPDGKRWDESGSASPALPTVSASAFLDGVETAAGSRP